MSESPEAGSEFVLSKPGPEIVKGIVIALKTMKKGEKLLLKLKPECRSLVIIIYFTNA